ncbi:MAG: sigma-E factor negative regulatory protein [Pigmentiphaga sp.]|nr:sigma-E factor negative regulatory protein [Pigmentiphaga sp.]
MTMGNQAERQPSDEALRSWVSALVDGEAPLPEASLRSLGQDGLREKWDTYHLIGDVMRTPDLAVQPSASFQQRLSAQLAAEPALLAAPARRALTPKGKWMSGLAVAAAVACVTWVAAPLLMESGGETGAPGVVAAVATPAVPAAMDVAFTDYLDAHRQLSGAAGGYRMPVSWSDEGSRH